MHTFMRESDRFAIGMWLPNLEGKMSFTRMLYVATLSDAIKIVCQLNGGSVRVALDKIVLVEKPTEEVMTFEERGPVDHAENGEHGEP